MGKVNLCQPFCQFWLLLPDLFCCSGRHETVKKLKRKQKKKNIIYIYIYIYGVWTQSIYSSDKLYNYICFSKSTSEWERRGKGQKTYFFFFFFLSFFFKKNVIYTTFLQQILSKRLLLSMLLDTHYMVAFAFSFFFFFFDQRLLYCSWDMNSTLREMNSILWVWKVTGN